MALENGLPSFSEPNAKAKTPAPQGRVATRASAEGLGLEGLVPTPKNQLSQAIICSTDPRNPSPVLIIEMMRASLWCAPGCGPTWVQPARPQQARPSADIRWGLLYRPSFLPSAFAVPDHRRAVRVLDLDPVP